MTRTVLVADDEPDIRFMATLQLRRHGWDVIEASDGDEAAQAVARHELDAMVLDHRMPGRTGIVVARGARASGFGGPIVLFSAYLNPDIEAEAAEIGVRTLGKADVATLAEALDAAG